MRTSGAWVGLFFVFGLLLGATAVAGSAAPLPAGLPSCRGAQQPKMIAELLFGRDIGARLGVSAAAWARFVADEIAPRFTDGFTITDAVGSWRIRRGSKTVREPSKRVEIVLPGHDDDQTRLDAVVSAYKRRFHQTSVGVIVWPACVAF